MFKLFELKRGRAVDFKTLKSFQAIVKYGSFIRAAQEMNYVQSTVTMQIQKLEAELGVPLLERGKELVLTEAGRLFYDQSMEIVKSMERLQTSLSNMKSGEAGHLRIGVTEPTASYRLPELLKKFMDRYPKVRLSVEISNTPALCDRILRGEIDFALATAPAMRVEIYFEPLFHEEFAVMLPELHPLAEKTVIDPEDLHNTRLLITSETCPYRRKLEMVMQERGMGIPDTMEIGSMTALKYYVEQGIGIALVPRIQVQSPSKGTTVRSISGSLIRMPIGILCKASAYPLNSAGERLYQLMKLEWVDHNWKEEDQHAVG